MNSILIRNSIKFFLLVIFQVILFNHINFMGYINPFPYLIFIFFFQIKNNRLLFLFLSFFIGLCIDIFSDSGGIHAAASVTIAYARPLFLKFSFGAMYEHQNLKFDNAELIPKSVYIALLTLLHHLVMFYLEVFSFARILMVLQKTLFSSIFTILMVLLISIIFSQKTK